METRFEEYLRQVTEMRQQEQRLVGMSGHARRVLARTVAEAKDAGVPVMSLMVAGGWATRKSVYDLIATLKEDDGDS